jgi:hypothetical protein
MPIFVIRATDSFGKDTFVETFDRALLANDCEMLRLFLSMLVSIESFIA